MEQKYETGQVAWYNTQRQFGKIKDGEDLIYFHPGWRICVADKARIPREGEEIVFSSKVQDRGPATTWWAFADEFNPDDIPVAMTDKPARSLAKRMRDQLAVFGVEELCVIPHAYVESKRERWSSSRRTVGKEVGFITLLTTPKDAFVLQPYERVTKILFEYDGLVPEIEIIKNRFVWRNAPDLKTLVAYILATDLEMIGGLPADAVDVTVAKSTQLLDRLTANSSYEEVWSCCNKRFWPNLAPLFAHYQRQNKISARQRMFLWDYEEIDVCKGILFRTAYREVFGKETPPKQ